MHVPEYPESDPSSSDLSLSESDYYDDSNYSKYKSKGCDKNKKGQKHTTQDSSESLLSNPDSSDESEYIHKRRKNKKSHRKKDTIKLCARLKAKLLTPAYKSKIIVFKPDEDPLKHQIYFITFVESPQIIFPGIKKLVKYS